MNIINDINKSFKYIKEKTNYCPKIGIILGTGFGKIADKLEDKEIYSYDNIPGFLPPTVEGHDGKLIIGRLKGIEVVVMKGRNHYYEGYSPQRITLPIRVMKLLGVEKLIVTNCGGQANPIIEAGDLVLIENHLNFSGCNPLIGENLDIFGERFPDLSYPYDKELREKVKEISKEVNVQIKEGVYAMFSGPSYETAAETRMVAKLGADVVGMSTIPEVIVANHCKMKVLAFSGIPCLAAAYSSEEITHEDVMRNCNVIVDKFEKIIDKFFSDIKI